jgi:hypothetical protein
MLSDNLRSMAAHFDAWGRRPAPVALDVATCEVLARQMRDLSAQAAQLEGQPVPPGGRALLGGNVVAFIPRRRASDQVAHDGGGQAA